ncbi:PIH1 domain-containing protein 2-like [Bolinopsis microptera]|uniref:PIH1 domain-containing protein 2-like n=1 Tax=Bolinopsis microptera TaxID=2820187 RepID=UPI003078FCF8
MAAPDHMLKEAEKIMKLLDDMHESNPDEYQQFIKKTLEEGKSEMKVAEFRFSIHGMSKKDSKKVFINVCGFPPVPAPKSDDDPISVHGGECYEEVVNGKESIIEYLGINPKVLDEVGSDKSLQKMLIKLAIDFYNDTKKYNMSYNCGFSQKLVGNPLKVNSAFTRSPTDRNHTKASSKSEPTEVKLPFDDIKDEDDMNFDKDFKITSDTKQNKTNLISELNSSNLKEIKFSTEILSEPRHCIKLKAHIDFIDSLNDIDLEIVDDDIVLTTDSFSVTRCKIPQFERIIEESIRAKFSKTKRLTITIDLKES